MLFLSKYKSGCHLADPWALCLGVSGTKYQVLCDILPGTEPDSVAVIILVADSHRHRSWVLLGNSEEKKQLIVSLSNMLQLDFFAWRRRFVGLCSVSHLSFQIIVI